MKKLKILSIVSLLFLSTLTYNVKAVTISGIQEGEKVCDKETHYYYFLWPANRSETNLAYDDLDARKNSIMDIKNKTTEQSSSDNIIIEPEIINDFDVVSDTVFGTETLKEGFKIVSIDDEPITNFTLKDYYMWFDAYSTQGSLTTADLTSETDVDGKVIYQFNNYVTETTDAEGNKVVHHFHGSWSGENHENADPAEDGGWMPYYRSLDKTAQVKFRHDHVNRVKQIEMASSARIGIGAKEDTFTNLNSNNILQIFDGTTKVTIKRNFSYPDSNNDGIVDIEPYSYRTNASSTDPATYQFFAYGLPAKVKVVIGYECQEKTCDEIIEEYNECIKDNTCSEEIKQKYAECPKPEEPIVPDEPVEPEPEATEENPETADLNVILVILVIIGSALVGYTTYREKKLNNN